jgi:hypothetical protein
VGNSLRRLPPTAMLDRFQNDQATGRNKKISDSFFFALASAFGVAFPRRCKRTALSL